MGSFFFIWDVIKRIGEEFCFLSQEDLSFNLILLYVSKYLIFVFYFYQGYNSIYFIYIF